ncbi:MAG: thermonuclease family protein [Comamonadaceae bacterium]|nr:MAG: thermonuclease family protein [Comamonadaceae bacterium]
MRFAGRTAGRLAAVTIALLAPLLVHAQVGDTGRARAGSPPFAAVVVRVVDGDTVWIQDAANRRARWAKVRIQGIDAPESCQPGGVASREALLRKVMDQRVRVSPLGRDDYGRLLARLSIGPAAADGDVGGWMVKNGQAWSYRFRADAGPYASEQRRARSAQRGLFADPAAEEPREFRKRHGPCPMPARLSVRPGAR